MAGQVEAFKVWQPLVESTDCVLPVLSLDEFTPGMGWKHFSKIVKDRSLSTSIGHAQGYLQFSAWGEWSRGTSYPRRTASSFYWRVWIFCKAGTRHAVPYVRRSSISGGPQTLSRLMAQFLWTTAVFYAARPPTTSRTMLKSTQRTRSTGATPRSTYT